MSKKNRHYYAPGDLASAGLRLDRGESKCAGCIAHPSPWCAGCGAPARHYLPADAHSIALCAACYAVLLDIRRDEMPAAAHLGDIPLADYDPHPTPAAPPAETPAAPMTVTAPRRPVHPTIAPARSGGYVCASLWTRAEDKEERGRVA